LTIGVIRASFGQSAGAVKGSPEERLDKDKPALSVAALMGAGGLPPRAAQRNRGPGGKVKQAQAILWFALALAASGRMAGAAGNAAAGETTFKTCRTCHRIGEGATNFVGPELNGVVGRKAGSVPGYHYSDANMNSGLTWDEATLTKFLRSPREVVPGTKMAFPGLQNDDDVANVIAYLKEFGPDGKKR
jgi:cytochrome c